MTRFLPTTRPRPRRGAEALLVALAVAAHAAPATAQEARVGRIDGGPSVRIVVPAAAEAGSDAERVDGERIAMELVLPAGRAFDPAGLEGVAAVTAALVGGSDPEAEPRPGAFDLGISVQDATLRVRLTTERTGLARALADLGDRVCRIDAAPTRIARIRRGMLRALEAVGRPDAIATRTVVERMYGSDHPAARRETAGTLERIDRAAVTAFHAAHVRPEAGLLVVTGDVRPGDVERAGAGVFAACAGAAGSPPSLDAGPARVGPTTSSPDVVLVHRPGMPFAEVRVGRRLEGLTPAETTALRVLANVLGGNGHGRFDAELPGVEAGRLLTTVLARTQVRSDLVIAGSIRESEAGALLNAILSTVARLRTNPVATGELRDAVEAIRALEAFKTDTSQGRLEAVVLGARVGGGLPPVPAPDLDAIGPEELRAVAASRLDPTDLVVVVVGDARRIRGQLQSLGSVEIVDEEGAPLSLTDLPAVSGRTPTAGAPAPGSGAETPARQARPALGEYRWRVSFGGSRVGSVVRTLSEGPVPGTLRMVSTTSVAGQEIRQEIDVDAPTFRLLRADQSLTAAGGEIRMRLERRGDRVTGTVTGPGGDTAIETPFPDDGVVGDLLELALWDAGFEAGARFEIPAFDPLSGGVVRLPVAVVGIEDVTVPAGDFRAWRVEVGGPAAQTLWLRVEAPHVVLRTVPSGADLAIELESLPDGG